MFGCRSYTQHEFHWNNFFLNLLVLVIIIVQTNDNVFANNVELFENQQDNETNCTTYRTCSQCIKPNICSWLIDKQECVIATNITQKQVSVRTVETCPNFDVTLVIQQNTNYSIIATISDKKSKLKKFFKNNIKACEIDDITYNIRLDDDKFICDLQISKSQTMSMFYFSIILNNNIRLKFNNEQDHYIIDNISSCPITDCIIGFWKNELNQLRYYCKWCNKNETCSIMQQQNNCYIWNMKNNQKITNTISNIEIKSPNAMIISFQPQFSTFTSQTTMIITIKNHYTLMQNKIIVVTVAGRECEYPETVNNETITCTLPRQDYTKEINGSVQIVYVSSTNYTLKSSDTFNFINPRITNINPICGSISKNTSININGEFLNATEDVRVVIGNNITCEIVNRSNKHIACLIGAMKKPMTGRVKLIVDNIMEIDSETLFDFVTEPNIKKGQQLEGIVAGGIQLPVLGNFSCVQNTPKLNLKYDNTLYSGDCKVINKTNMICLTPNFAEPNMQILPTILPISFQMNFADKKQIFCPLDTNYLLHPDPTYDNFVVNNTILTINGNFSYTGYEHDDIIVRLQNSSDTCNVSFVHKMYITCNTLSSAENVQKIIITVGQYLNNTVGKLSHNNNSQSTLVNALSEVSTVSVFIMLIFGLLFFLKTILNNYKNRNGKRYMEELRNITAGIEEPKY